MAQQLARWWRNKFRAGYDKFHLGDGERTDTEQLVGRAASQCSAPPDLLPSEARALLQPVSPEPRSRFRHSPDPTSSPHTTYTPRAPHMLHVPLTPLIPLTPLTPRTPHNASVITHVPSTPGATTQTPTQNDQQDKPPRLRFEELHCDVQVQHETPNKQQPLQFSFTLYDLDGHGRMTKDDIAGIVSTIYESVGKSVTVPHYGSKTIQVRLTVVPEPTSPTSLTSPPAPERTVRRDGRRRPRRRKETSTNNPLDCGDATDDERRSRFSIDDDASSCSGERRRRVRTRSARTQLATPSSARPPRHAQNKEHRERRPSKKRSGSLQRRELLEIIQANMEKNHLSFQTSRKPHEKVINEEDCTNNNNNNIKQHRHRNRAFTVSSKPGVDTFHRVKSEHPANGYLDLAHNDRINNMDSNLCRYDRYLHAVICSSAKHANSGYHQNTPTKPQKTPRTHHRSRSHDVPPRIAPAEPRVLQIIFL